MGEMVDKNPFDGWSEEAIASTREVIAKVARRSTTAKKAAEKRENNRTKRKLEEASKQAEANREHKRRSIAAKKAAITRKSRKPAHALLDTRRSGGELALEVAVNCGGEVKGANEPGMYLVRFPTGSGLERATNEIGELSVEAALMPCGMREFRAFGWRNSE